MTPASPLFVVIEPTGARAREPVTRIAWACASEAGVAHADDFPHAARRIAALGKTHPLHLADPLFDEPRLVGLLESAGVKTPPDAADWLLALAPFGQAKSFAAILDAASVRADPDNPATRLLEAWREAAARADGKTRQPKT